MAVYGKNKESYESIYLGSYSPLDPEYGPLFTGYRVPFSNISAPTSIQTANQIGEVSARLSEGVRAVELQPVSPEVFEGIPKQHLKEIERLGKLTGAEFSIHAPVIDPAGFTREGWNEAFRQHAEVRIKNSIDRAHQLSPKGNIPIAMHATGGLPSSEWKMVEGKPQKQTLAVVNRETGQLTTVEREERYFPYLPEVKKEEPEEVVDIRNSTDWNRNIMAVVAYKKDADTMLSESWPFIAPEYKRILEQQRRGEQVTVPQALEPHFRKFQMAMRYYREVSLHIHTLYDRAYKYAPEEHKELYRGEITEQTKLFKEKQKELGGRPWMLPELFHESIAYLENRPPNIYVPTKQFALEHSKETLANAVLYSYKKYGDNAPILALENVYPNTVFGRAEGLGELITETRKTFVEKARKAGISVPEARRAAEKLIGATWDVGHINLIRKQGFPKEEVVAETKKIAPFVKHVHLTDNFGFEDSHLPPGMGEVPFKEMLKELEKAGFKGKEVIEAGGFVAQFKRSPTPYVLEAFGSPLYAAYMQPFWNQVRGGYGVPAGYSSGYGMMLPEQHFSIYGGGWSALPAEIGGQVAGKGKRFSGAPME